MRGEDMTMTLLGFLFGLMLSVVIGSLIGAVLLRASAKWIADLDVDFDTAFVTALLIAVCNTIAGFVIGLIAVGFGAPELSRPLSFLVGFLIASGIIGERLKVEFGKAAAITLVMAAIGIAIALVIGAVVFVVMSAV